MSIDDRQNGRNSDQAARERLLDVAARVFAEDGFQQSSIESIAAAAGVPTDTLLRSFESKTELFFALLGERVDARLTLLVQQAEAVAGEDSVTPLVGREVNAVVDEQRQIMLLMQEYWSLAARDPELGARYAERQRWLRALIAQGVVAHHEATSVALTHDPGELATAVIALASGLALDRIIDPESVPDRLFGEMLQLLYDGLILRSASAALKPAGNDTVD
jgi:AcrR family transcriptional regulator